MPWLGRLATLAALALLAWLCASIYWRVAAPPTPRPATEINSDPQRLAQAIVAHHPFGAATAATALAAGPASANLSGDIKLNGVIAAQTEGQAAYALLTIAGKPAQVVREGEEIAPGLSLRRVLPRAVDLMRGGQPLTLTLPEYGKP